jgi:hypothetical protein
MRYMGTYPGVGSCPGRYGNACDIALRTYILARGLVISWLQWNVKPYIYMYGTKQECIYGHQIMIVDIVAVQIFLGLGPEDIIGPSLLGLG